jgi:DNA-binding IclR family transcriptional regulator
MRAVRLTLPTMAAVTSEDPPSGTQTLDRGLSVIRAVAGGASDLGSVVGVTGIGRSTAHRLVQLLVQRGYLTMTDGTNYTLGPSLIEFGFLALAQNPLVASAQPVLDRLSRECLDTVHLAVREHDTALYLGKISGSRGAEMRSKVGGRMPLTRTGVGKALLLNSAHEWVALYEREQPAEPQQDRGLDDFLGRMRKYAKIGVAFDLEDNEPGIRCVAAPVHDADGKIIAAVSVSATVPYLPHKRMRGLVPLVKRAANDIARTRGFPALTP